ncbi:hypothetical protein HW555_008253 [Spodoptera exigua]|uniref:Uncharacterized protein n=1 Tax=Spodoptera exigua TaxID=7107 RepID=A0A835GEL4_SPOEX|nr:hypothetical protein HW555_008253 [Spodoptera exigua]
MRLAASTTNVMFASAPLTRRASALQLDTSDTDNKDEPERSPAPVMWSSVARRRTDLVPTVPAPRAPGRAYSMTRLDRLPASRPLHSASPSMHHLNRAQPRSGDTTPGSRPGSALSNATAVLRRPHSAPRKPRPASIAGTGVNTPRAPPVTPGEGKPPVHRKPKPSKEHEKGARGKSLSASPGRTLSPSPAQSKDASVDKEINKVNEIKETVEVKEETKIEQVTEVTKHEERASERSEQKDKEDKKEPSVEKTEDNEMTASMTARRITTEEEAKAALAERRRRAREELERQAELERQRLQREAEEEAERQRQEEERQRREEEEARELAQLQRQMNEEKLRKAIETEDKAAEQTTTIKLPTNDNAPITNTPIEANNGNVQPTNIGHISANFIQTERLSNESQKLADVPKILEDDFTTHNGHGATHNHPLTLQNAI